MPNASDANAPAPSRSRLMVGSLIVGLICFAALLGTSPWLPMTWDEGGSIERAFQIVRWIDEDAAGGGRFSREAIRHYWPFTTQIEGHPAFYAIVIASGAWLSAEWLAPLDAFRLGPMALFGLAAGLLFYRMSREYSTAAAAGAVAALMVLPRMFAHAHFASYDGTLTACWILAWATFAPARQSWRAAVVWGIALGLTLSSKATGWVAPVPFVIWAILYRDRRAARALAIGLPAAMGVFLLTNPPLWHAPIRGMGSFLRLNFERTDFNIAVQFFGQIYDHTHSLPWYNALVWTGIAVPTGTLLLAGVGLVSVCRRWRREPGGILIVGHWLILLVVRALPLAPPHDGIRLFLPSFAFLAMLAGVGVGVALGWANRPEARGRTSPRTWHQAAPRAVPAAILLLYLGSLSSLLWYAPQWLSHYNLAIGGLPGATAAGMEPTYYWDGLDRSVLDWLDEHTAEDEKVLFGAAPSANLPLMRAWGQFEFEYGPEAPGRPRWYVLQRRPSKWWAVDRWLIANRKPVYQKTIRPGGWGPWRLDVPLVEIYSHEDLSTAVAATKAP